MHEVEAEPPLVARGSPSPASREGEAEQLPRDWAANLPKLVDIKPLPFPELPDVPPHEGAMFNVPIVVDPPDILLVEVLESLPGRPIQGERLVRPDGTINLGFYGDIYVRGLTPDQIKVKIVLHLRKFLNDDVLGLIGRDLDAEETDPPVKDQHLTPLPDLPKVDPKGLFVPDADLEFGRKDPFAPALLSSTKAGRSSPFRLVGGTSRAVNTPKIIKAPQSKAREPQVPSAPVEAPAAIPSKGKLILIPPAESDAVVVDVASYNSKVYFVQGAVNFTGRFPYSGNETVLDAIQYAGNLAPDADHSTLRIVRPAWGKKPAEVHYINLDALLNNGDKTANLQMLPGDRLIVDSKR